MGGGAVKTQGCGCRATEASYIVKNGDTIQAHDETLLYPGARYVIINDGRKNVSLQLQQTTTVELCVCVSSNRTQTLLLLSTEHPGVNYDP